MARVQPEHASSEMDRGSRHGRAGAKESPIGWIPRYEDIDWEGLDFPKEKFAELQAFDREDWRAEVIGA